MKSYGPLHSNSDPVLDQILRLTTFGMRVATAFVSMADESSQHTSPSLLCCYMAFPLRSPQGMFIGSLCLVNYSPRDLSPRDKLLLEGFASQVMLILELRRQNAALMAAQVEILKVKQDVSNQLRFKTDFVAQLSHEIRTPLNVIQGIAGQMLETELAEKQRSSMMNMRRSSQHILRLLNNILDHSKLESGRFIIDQNPFPMEEALHDIVSPLQTLAKQKGLDLHLEFSSGPLPVLLGDSLRLSQVLVNLIHNAIKFTKKGWIKVAVAVVEENNGKALLHFQVQDSGPGLSSEDCIRIFKAYQQVSSSHAIDGSGLGLSIAKKLVEAMHGQIGVKSTLGEGSTFWCMIPFEIAENVQRLDIPEVVTDLRFPKARILLVEDDPLNGEITLQYLQSLGSTADLCADAALALKRVASEHYDLVLTDYRLPDTDGSELAATLRSLLPIGTPILALTGQDRSLVEGLDDYLQKPFDRAQLQNLLKDWLTPLSPAEIESCQEALDKIRAHSKADFLPRLIRGFLNRNPDQLRKMHNACRDADWKNLGLLAHSMKSTLASFGIFSLSGLCRKIESQMDDGQFTDAWADVQALRRGMVAWYRHLDTFAEAPQKAAS